MTSPANPGVFANATTLTITAGGTSQQVFASIVERRYLFVVNTSDTIMYLAFGAAATSASIPLPANGGYYEPLVAPGQSVNLLCATTGKTYIAIQA